MQVSENVRAARPASELEGVVPGPPGGSKGFQGRAVRGTRYLL